MGPRRGGIRRASGSAAPVSPRQLRPGDRAVRYRSFGLYGAPVSNEMPRAGEDELPEADEALAAALTAPGVWALGLLRDARRILVGGFLQRPAEVADPRPPCWTWSTSTSRSTRTTCRHRCRLRPKSAR